MLPHLDDAYTLARYLLRDEHDAQDVVQDAALRAFRHIDSFRGDDPRAWFLVVVRNCCRTWQRRHRGDRRLESLDGDAPLVLEESRPADARAIQQSDRAMIEKAVADLPLEYREVLVLREVHDLTYAQISDVVGVPVGTVMSRLSRARRRLAHAMGRMAKEVG